MCELLVYEYSWNNPLMIPQLIIQELSQEKALLLAAENGDRPKVNDLILARADVSCKDDVSSTFVA